MDDYYTRIAKAIKGAKFLHVLTGAGFSADSGLLTYPDVDKIPAYKEQNLKYHDLCRPSMMTHRPELFYGFWGKCHNDYMEKEPHIGYDILRRWKEQYFLPKTKKQASDAAAASSSSSSSAVNDDGEDADWFAEFKREQSANLENKYCGKDIREIEHAMGYNYDETLLASNVFCYTSNVDGHFQRYFPRREVYEIHGSVDYWQCSLQRKDSPCYEKVWYIPREHRFDVDPNTLHAIPPPKKELDAITKRTAAMRISSKPSNSYIEISSLTNESADTTEAHESTSTEVNDEGDAKALDEISSLVNDMSIRDEQKPKGFTSNYPTCIYCGALARPNVLMFGDGGCVSDEISSAVCSAWVDAMTTVIKKLSKTKIAATVHTDDSSDDDSEDDSEDDEDDDSENNNNVKQPAVVILEIGCGLRVPSVRWHGEFLLRALRGEALYVRINPNDYKPDISNYPNSFIGLPVSGKEALVKIDEILSTLS